jgi:hypothetical protein
MQSASSKRAVGRKEHQTQDSHNSVHYFPRTFICLPDCSVHLDVVYTPNVLRVCLRRYSTCLFLLGLLRREAATTSSEVATTTPAIPTSAGEVNTARGVDPRVTACTHEANRLREASPHPQGLLAAYRLRPSCRASPRSESRMSNGVRRCLRPVRGTHQGSGIRPRAICATFRRARRHPICRVRGAVRGEGTSDQPAGLQPRRCMPIWKRDGLERKSPQKIC